MPFEPIAIVGQSCVLPGALTPAELWANAIGARMCLSRAPLDRWRLPRASVMASPDDSIDRSWTDVGGYVRGFDARFDPSGFQIPADQILELDRLFHWVLHGVREALAGVGHDSPAPRAGLVLGNLSFPTATMTRYAESVWLDAQGDRFAGGDAAARAGITRPHPRNRFSSGLPAHLAARALGLGAGAFALDAACASSLYAIKLACDRLHDRTADVMVAGAVSATDDLLIHVGFCALGAMSRSGRSRPFHQDADGLVPAEGAGFVVLQRLGDAIAQRRAILGVIRGVGLSNDGRGRGLMAPSEEGQERAMRRAYAAAELTPADVGYVECHATGTPIGDATELRSMARVFDSRRGVPIGSLKSNIGHLFTASGIAALLKVVASFDSGRLAPTLHVDRPLDILQSTPFRLLDEPEAWNGPRRAAVSAFGFGGNNAHLIVEAWDGRVASARPAAAPSRPPAIAIVSVGARVGDGESARDFARTLVDGVARREPRTSVTVALDGLKFPPRDLAQSLAQQTLVLEAAREATEGLSLPRDTTAVLVGMGCDAEIARFSARWRLAGWADAWSRHHGVAGDRAWLAEARAQFQSELEAAHVVGRLPNVPANRINSQLDVAGPSFTVAAEEASGIVALDLAGRALRAGEIDAAVVGGVDLSHEIVHATALDAVDKPKPPGDAAIVLVLKRLEDAERDGDPVFAILDRSDEDSRSTEANRGERRDRRAKFFSAFSASSAVALGDVAPDGLDLTTIVGHAHAASGLLHVAAGALALRHRARLHVGAAATPWVGERAVEIAVSVLEALPATVRLSSASSAPWLADPAPPRLWIYSGVDRDDALAALADRREGDDGPARLVIVAAGEAERSGRAQQARQWLTAGGPPPEGIAFRSATIDGELAFVFTGAASAYRRMGRDLALAMPDLVDAAGVRSLVGESSWLYGDGEDAPQPLDQLSASSFLCQLHAMVTRHVLKLEPSATIGYSSGESNALFAMGAWTDLDAMIADCRRSEIFTHELAGECRALQRAWNRAGESDRWASYSVSAPVDEVRAALASEPFVHLTIVNTPDDCVIGGEATACARVAERIGSTRVLGYALAAHCPEVGEIRDAWRQLHRREARDVPGVRFYTNATATWFRPTSDAAADAMTGQALATLDFPRLVEQAYADGVRVFVEHGPRGLCSGWIRRILGERDHVAVPLDVAGRSGVRQVLNAAAWLVAAGRRVDVRALEDRLAAAAGPAPSTRPVITLPAHPDPPRLPEFDTAPQVMARAPALASTFDRPFGLPVSAPTAQPAEHAHSRVGADIGRPGAEQAPPLRVLHELEPVGAAAGSAAASALSRLAAHQAQIGALHRAFLAQQTTVHERFLTLQRTSAARLLQTYDAVVQARSAEAFTLHRNEDTERSAKAFALHPPSPWSAKALAERPIERPLPGPKFNRAQLEVLAGGRISSVFGPLFAAQDGYVRQVRMPEPPLLLADRVAGIDAAPGSMGTGTLWTETDVREDSWYLNAEGRMPAGIMIEAGQADLLLISWLGVDLLNRGERVYRLLGCELTYHGGLCRPGDRLAFDIHVDRHATQGDVRLFFFRYNCRVNGEPRFTVRNAQAGFFTDEELRNSNGVLWDCADEPCRSSAALDPPAIVCTKQRFDREEINAFADGRPFDCFGRGWEATRAHVRTPRITSGRLLFLDEVTDFDPRGGPWGRGYLRAETPVSPDDWFFDGHFKNDPCMPGTLMFEACLQTMAFYIGAMGFTASRDGWVFEPVPEEKLGMRCRGQVTPANRRLVYEVFVSDVMAGPVPTVFADLLCTVDGLKAFHARRVGLRLVPDWPLEHWKNRPPAAQLTGDAVPLPVLGGLRGFVDPRPAATVDGFTFGYASLLACAWGRATMAFGPTWADVENPLRVPRLPGPPYHFISRVADIDGPMSGMQSGSTVVVEYDVPVEQWYFEQNGSRTMPICVLLEAALQPCGWIALYVGSARGGDTDLLFRNLDGTGTVFEELPPGCGTLRTRVRLASISRTAEMTVESFVVECFLGERRVFQMNTVCGIFRPEAFDNQVGLPVSADERARMAAPSERTVDLSSRPAKYFAGELRLPGPMLTMIDRVSGYWPEGGRAGLGYLRAEKDVDAGAWFFKAHFFTDPVQPGSLGIEAMCQLLQFYMIERGLATGVDRPRFEPIVIGRAVSWKFRGQVVPTNRLIAIEMEIVETGGDDRGVFAIAESWLWVDGKRIYHAKNIGMRVVAGTHPSDTPGSGIAVKTAAPPSIGASEETLDPAVDTWLADHCPTWTVPVLPLMSMVDRLAAAAASDAGREVAALENIQLRRWLPFPGGPQRVRTEVAGDGDTRAVTLLAWRDASDPALSRFEPVVTGVARLGPRSASPATFAPLPDVARVADPYASGGMFHGPAFQYLTELFMGSSGSSAVLVADRGSVPRGHLHQGLLDAATHAIPHDALWQWSADVSRDLAAYPHRIPEMRFHGPLPAAGPLHVDVRFAGFDDVERRLPRFDIQIAGSDGVLVSFRLVGILLPKGPIGTAPPDARRAFLRDRRYVPDVSLSSFDATTTRLSESDVRQSDWLPGNVTRIYAVPADRRHALAAEVAVREHVARRAFVHPSTVTIEGDYTAARAAMRPLRLHPIRLVESGDVVHVSDAAPPIQDLAPVRDYWRRRIGIGPWPIEDFYYGLIARFVGDVVFTDPEAFARVRGRSCLYLANHQVGIESLLFSVVAAGLSDTPTVTLAKAEHRSSWLGRLIAHSFTYPGVTDPQLITFFDREDRESLPRIVGELATAMRGGAKSAMVHVEGTRALAARRPVVKMSSAFIDMALAVGAPIVPVRFVGGLPIDEQAKRLEFPVGYGRQDYWIGRPILPEQLAALPYKDRKTVVIDAINGLGPEVANETPSAPDPLFAAGVEAWMAQTDADAVDAVLFTTLALLQDPGPAIRALCDGARSGRLVVDRDPRSQWLASLAQMLFGPHGPAVVTR